MKQYSVVYRCHPPCAYCKTELPPHTYWSSLFSLGGENIHNPINIHGPINAAHIVCEKVNQDLSFHNLHPFTVQEDT